MIGIEEVVTIGNMEETIAIYARGAGIGRTAMITIVQVGWVIMSRVKVIMMEVVMNWGSWVWSLVWLF